MKKITILGLHLGYGGVERSIINQANSLCNKYNVELVVNYKILDNPAFKVNENVKIKYLMDLVPNRKEFNDALRSKKILSLFKEGIKSLNILYLKTKTMKNYISQSDADIIISSRVEIAKLLGKYKKENVITITEEHAHHNNNKKYIKKLKNACKNIDYIVAVSKELQSFYKKEITTSKSIYIPNGLNDWPKECSKLEQKNLISVGRLSPEKGYNDLIDVFKIINEKDHNTYLNIVGDGTEYEKLYEKIKAYNLSNNVKLHGFQNKDYIDELLDKSSIYVMTSFEESFGIVLIEAGSHGVPQVAFDSAQGAKEIIKNNKSGYLIKERDKELMARKILELLDDKKTLKEFGKEAELIAQEFTFEKIQDRWLNFINSILNERSEQK